MKDLATFIGGGGKTKAIIYEGDGFWKVNYGPVGEPTTFSKVFMSESAATEFAVEYTDKGNKPTLLSESNG
jgi:hypothetical protein